MIHSMISRGAKDPSAISRRGALLRLAGASAFLSAGTVPVLTQNISPTADSLLIELEALFSATWDRVTDEIGTHQRYRDAASIAEVIAIVPAQTLAGIVLKARVAASSKAFGDSVVKLPFETQRRLEIRAEVERKTLEAHHAR